ncbi:MAG: hypothetical protein LBE83_04265 [Propionibacteriaceae bacterium]|nr:hypothetical protein [Propionibacteriaceae bacterium]
MRIITIVVTTVVFIVVIWAFQACAVSGIINCGSLLPYVVVLTDAHLAPFKGLQAFNLTTTWGLVLPMWFVTAAFVIELISRLRAKRLGADLAAMIPSVVRFLRTPVRVFRTPGLERAYGLGLALLVVFFAFNPIIIVVIALWGLLSMGSERPGGPLVFFVQAKMDFNRLRRRDLEAGIERTLGFTGGFIVGLWGGGLIVLLSWFAFDYALWARLVFLILPAIIAFVLPPILAKRQTNQHILTQTSEVSA